MNGENPRLKPWMLWTLMFLLTAALAHVIVESVVQLFFAKHSGVAHYLDEFKEKAKQDGLSVEQYAKKVGLDPYLGWGKSELRIHEPVAGTNPIRTVLFVGDSVTAGHDVRGGVEDYPARLAAQWGGQGVRVVNIAARGYGVDQMWLKLLTTANVYHPDAIVLAYIPHDLLRPANDFNFGLPKPRFKLSGARIDLALAENIADYIADYESARSGFRLSEWQAARYWENREYYLPPLFLEYYQGLYRHIGEGLAKLSQENGIPVLVVKLTNKHRVSGHDQLVALAASGLSHTGVWDKADLRYVDTDGCVLPKAQAQGVDSEKEFAHHPGPVGHRLLAECLAPAIEAALGKRGTVPPPSQQ